MSSVFLKSQKSKRQPSRRGAESPSALNVQYVGSNTASRQGVRYPILNHTTPNAQGGSEQPSEVKVKHRRRASHNSVGSYGEGIGSLNRWSQSTVSSKSSVNAHQRSNSFARRLSGSFGSFAGYTSLSPQKTGLRKNTSPTRAASKMESRDRSRNRSRDRASSAQGGLLAPVVTLPPLGQNIDNARVPRSTEPRTPPANAASSSSHVGGSRDYFGNSWAGISPARPAEATRAPNRSPGNTSYATSPAIERITPGANNSFARTSPTRPNNARNLSSRTLLRSQYSNDSSEPRQPSRDGDRSGGENGRSASVNGQGQRRRQLSQKQMLAQALEKANDAVLLDNDSDHKGAIAAYNQACDLLYQVMVRSPGEDDKRKLREISDTYKVRIAELESITIDSRPQESITIDSRPQVDKELPEVPKSNSEPYPDEFLSPLDADEDPDGLKTTIIERDPAPSSIPHRTYEPPTPIQAEQIPPRRQSLLGRDQSRERISNSSGAPAETTHMNQPIDSMLSVPKLEQNFMPLPLSPRPPNSPKKQSPARESSRSPKPQPETAHMGHTRQETAESTSWLDTIDESGGSSSSSVHSRSSFQGLRRKNIRRGSGDTEAEFDAALDAAVEAAYDEGYEPASDVDERYEYEPLSFGMDPSGYRRNVDLAKKRVRDAEREQALAFGEERDDKSLLEHPMTWRTDQPGLGTDDEDAEEEERILDNVTRGWEAEDPERNSHSKGSLPRGSSSSTFSGRTWGSSIGSMPATTASVTPLSTVSETPTLPRLPDPMLSKSPEMHSGSFSARKAANSKTEVPPPPPIPKTIPPVPPFAAGLSSPGIRTRRLSGQKHKQLKIDTSARLPAGLDAPKTQPPSKLGSLPSEQLDEPPKSATFPREPPLEPPGSSYNKTFLLNSGSAALGTSPFPTASPSEPGSGLSESVTSTLKPRDPNENLPPPSPVRPPTKTPSILRKNFSSSSLKSLRQQNVPATSAAEDSPSTPLTKVFSSSSLRGGPVPSVPELPAPPIGSLKGGHGTGSISFLDSEIHSASGFGSSDPTFESSPVPLEPCPESFLLRPYWLMRAIYQTIANPRGGYVTTRLFVPRDIWRVRNVKLKNVEDKVGACDLLVAGLLNLSRSDTIDADRVLDQMQGFELTLDMVQASLGKKLGAEVGTQSANALFKGDALSDEPGTAVELQSAKSTNRYFSLRKLGRKASLAPGLASSAGEKGSKETFRENLNMKSLPMTSLMNPRFAKREVGKIVAIGPHAHYMSALARLCDAAQVLDHIARQVEDPGLRHSSQAHVGLELSIRHASEFFAFYICRFVLNDIGLMLDKFVKRGSEWVNS